MTFSPDGNSLVVANALPSEPITIYGIGHFFTSPLEEGKQIQVMTLEGHEGFVTSLAFNPDGDTIASGGDDFMVKLWSVTTGECLAIVDKRLNQLNVVDVAFSPKGDQLAVGYVGGLIELWSESAEPTAVSIPGSVPG